MYSKCKFKCLLYYNKNKSIKDNSKTSHAIVNANLMVENVIQIKSEIKNSLDLRAKSNTCVKKIIYIGNPSARFCEIDNYLKSITYDLVITCDEIIDVMAKSHNDPTNFN